MKRLAILLSLVALLFGCEAKYTEILYGEKFPGLREYEIRMEYKGAAFDTPEKYKKTVVLIKDLDEFFKIAAKNKDSNNYPLIIKLIDNYLFLSTVEYSQSRTNTIYSYDVGEVFELKPTAFSVYDCIVRGDSIVIEKKVFAE